MRSFQVNNLGRHRFQHKTEVFGLLLSEMPSMRPLVVNPISDDGHALDLVVEHDGQIVADVIPGPFSELF